MLISLRNDHKEHLKLLTEQSPQVVLDFCKLAIDFIQNGPNLKRYTIAAQKLETEAESIQNCVYGLVNLLLLSCKNQLGEADFRDSVLTLGFHQEQQEILSKYYESRQKEIHEILNTELNEPHYENLRWRFEAQVSSRTLLHQITPLFTMELQLKTQKENGKSEQEKIILQTDPNNLLHIANELEQALNESKGRHSRRIQRALKN